MNSWNGRIGGRPCTMAKCAVWLWLCVRTLFDARNEWNMRDKRKYTHSALFTLSHIDDCLHLDRWLLQILSLCMCVSLNRLGRFNHSLLPLFYLQIMSRAQYGRGAHPNETIFVFISIGFYSPFGTTSATSSRLLYASRTHRTMNSPWTTSPCLWSRAKRGI